MKNPKSPILLHYTTLFVVLSSLSLPPFISFPLCSSSSSSQPNRSIFLQTPLPFLSQLSFPHNPKSGFSFFVCCFFPLFFFTFTPFSTDYCVFPFFLNIFFFLFFFFFFLYLGFLGCEEGWVVAGLGLQSPTVWGRRSRILRRSRAITVMMRFMQCLKNVPWIPMRLLRSFFFRVLFSSSSLLFFASISVFPFWVFIALLFESLWSNLWFTLLRFRGLYEVYPLLVSGVLGFQLRSCALVGIRADINSLLCFFSFFFCLI